MKCSSSSIAAPQTRQARGSDSDSVDTSAHVSDSEDQAIPVLPASAVDRGREIDHGIVRGVGSDAGSEGTVVLEP